MDTTRSLLERLRSKYAGCSDYRLAKILGLSKTAMTRYTRHGGGMSHENGVKIAVELELQPEYVLACLAYEREQVEHIKPYWERLANATMQQLYGRTAHRAAHARRKAKVAGVALALISSGFLAPSPSEVRVSDCAGSVYYVTSKRDRFRARIGRPRRIRRRRPLQLPAAAPITAEA